MLRPVVPGAATQYTSLAVTAQSPGAAVSRGMLIVIMPTVLRPLPNIPVHIMKSKIVRWIRVLFMQFEFVRLVAAHWYRSVMLAPQIISLVRGNIQTKPNQTVMFAARTPHPM